jgi:hypothetical protein
MLDGAAPSGARPTKVIAHSLAWMGCGLLWNAMKDAGSGRRGRREGGRRPASNSLSQARADIGRAAGPFE